MEAAEIGARVQRVSPAALRWGHRLPRARPARGSASGLCVAARGGERSAHLRQSRGPEPTWCADPPRDARVPLSGPRGRGAARKVRDLRGSVTRNTRNENKYGQRAALRPNADLVSPEA